MKYSINSNSTKELVNLLGIVVATKEDILDITFGIKDADDTLHNAATITSKGEQVSISFTTPKPEGWEGVEKVAVNATGFFKAISTLQTLGEVYVDTSAKTIGAGELHLPLGEAQEEKIPPRIELKKEEITLQINAKISDIIRVLRQGGRSVDTSSSALKAGSGNIGLYIGESELKVYSTDKASLNKSTCPIKVALPLWEKISSAEGYDEKSGELGVFLPKSAIDGIVKYLSIGMGKNENASCIMAFDKSHVFVAYGQTGTYTCTQAGIFCVAVKVMDTWEGTRSTMAVVDRDVFKANLETLNAAIELANKSKTVMPISVEITDKAVVLKGTTTDLGYISIPAVNTVGTGEIFLNGVLLKDIVSTLGSGNLRLGIGSSNEPIELTNGDLTKKAPNAGVSFVLPVNIPKEEETATEE